MSENGKERDKNDIKKGSKKDIEIEKFKMVEDKYLKHLEDEKFQQEVDKKVTEASNLIRIYETELKKGNFELEPPYQKVIGLYEEMKKLLLERDWKEQANTYSNQINLIKQKLKQDHKLRELEEKKKQKSKEYLETLKDRTYKEIDVEKIKSAEDKFRKDSKDKEFQTNIDLMESQAKNLERAYDVEIKKKNFDIEPPFDKILEIYGKIKALLNEREWFDQVNINTTQINYIKQKQEQDRKLRELETKKKEKESAYLESLKTKKTDSKYIEKLKIAEEKIIKGTEDKEFQKVINEMATEAERMIRDYETEIKKNNFEIECVYPIVIKIYEEIRNKLNERKWVDQSLIYQNQIKLLNEKIAQDEKLRLIEARKKEKEITYVESQKVKQKQKIDVEKVKAVEERVRIETEDHNFQNKLDLMVDQAKNLEREYDMEIKKKNFDIEPPFDKILEIYENIKILLIERKWLDQINIYTNQINLIKQKQEQDKKLRELETKKKEKETTYLQSLKFKKKEKIDLQKLRATEERIKKEVEDKAFQEEINSRVSQCENLIREYEIEIKKGDFDLDAPYQKVIDIYNTIREQFQQRGWSDQAVIYQNQINIIKNKLEKNRLLRDIELKKKEKDEIFHESLKVKEHKKIEYSKLRAAEEKLKREDEDEVFQKEIISKVNQAEGLVRNYEIEKKKGNFDAEVPYQKVIDIYNIIKEQLLERGWTDQALLYQNQIKTVEQKIEQDKVLREFEVQKQIKQTEYQEQIKLKKEIEPLELESTKLKQIEEKHKKDFEDDVFQNKITIMVNQAEELARKYEFAIRQGKFEEKCPYQEIINIYEDIRNILVEKGWNDQALVYIKQINYYMGKLAKDKKVREFEAQKVQKQKEYEATLKVRKDDRKLKADLEKLKSVEEIYQKELEKENFQKEISNMVNKAEEMARKYELAMRQGKFETKCPYEEIIDIYTRVKNILIEKGWNDEAINYIKQINVYLGKLDKDKKLREIEGQKVQKQKEYQDLMKKEREDKQLKTDIDKLKIAEDIYKKELEDEYFENQISKMVDQADEMGRKYEFAIRQNKFEAICPYEQIINIYTEVKNKLIERGWIEQATIYANQINHYLGKLENDKKLREFEARKAEKQKIYEDLSKTKKEDKKLEADIKKMETLEEQYKINLEEEDFEIQISKMVDEADNLARKYELTLRKGNFEENCPYPTIIEIYTRVREKLIEKGWIDEAMIYLKQIQLYQEKLESDKKLREIETLKMQKQKEFENQFLITKEFKILDNQASKIKIVEDKRKFLAEEEEFQREITKVVDNAEEMARKYEYEIRKGNFEEECPYSKIIDMYITIHKQLLEKGWKNESLIFKNQIEVYQEKLENAEKLKRLEAQKEIKRKQLEQMMKVQKVEVVDTEKFREKEVKRKEKEKILEEGFNLIDRAEKLVKEYEIKLKLEKSILEQSSPYEQAIEIYKQAKYLFQDYGWMNEANKLTNTIKYYEEKQASDEKLRALERTKLEEAELKVKVLTSKPSLEVELLTKKQKVSELEEQKRRQEEISNAAFKMINDAERAVKEYELKLKEGIYPEPPFENVISMYRGAKKKFEEISWDDQANNLVNTINYYKERAEGDKKLRALEAEKIKKQKKELEEQQLIVRRLRRKDEEALKLKKEALLSKVEKEKEYGLLKTKAFSFMDQANRYLNLDNFEEAIRLYRESEKVFRDMNWAEGLNMVQESITVIKNKKQEQERQKMLIKEEEAEKIRLEQELEREITKSKELEKLRHQLQREELFKIQTEKEIEKTSSEKAYKLLEEGTKFQENKKFNEAYNKYMEALEIFKEIDWFHEVSRINNELLVTLKEEEKKVERLEDYKKKKLEEEAELQRLVIEAEKQKAELEESKVKGKREKLAQLEISDKLKSKIQESIQRANIEIQNFRYNKAILMLKEVIRMMRRVGWEKEIADINNQIFVLGKKTHIPLITIDELEKDENKEKFEKAYYSLDKAQVSLLKNRFMKAISELNEAKFNLEQTQTGTKYVSDIDNKINELKNYFESQRKSKDISDIKGIEIEEGKQIELSPALAYEYMDKCNKEERRNNFKKAIECATTAKEIFTKLGSEWSKEIITITRHISTLENKQVAREESFKRKREELEQKEQALKQEEEEFKKQMTARKEARRQKLRELLKEK